MGCDIHCVLERKAKINGVEKWVGVHAFPYLTQFVETHPAKEGGYTYAMWRATGRNYRFFGELAGVRGDSSIPREPLGIPPDASDLALIEIDCWGADGHSHSHLSAYEFAKRYVIAKEGPAALITARLEGADDPVLAALDDLFECDERDSPDEYRVVFWFDN